MSVLARLGAFAAVLALTFGGGLALGAAVGPDTPAPPPTHRGVHPEPSAPTPAAPTSAAPTSAAPTSHTAHPPGTQERQP